MNAVTMVLVAMLGLGLGSGQAVAGDTLKVPEPPKVLEVAKNAVVGAGNAMLSTPCVAGTPKDGKKGAAGSAICNEVAGQLATSLSTQTAPSAKNIGAIAKVAAVGAVGSTLSTPCTAGMPKDGKAGSAICNEVAGQLATSLSTQKAPSAKNIGAIAKVAAVGAVGSTLSAPCTAGMSKDGKAGSAICNEVAGQLAASLSSQTAPSAKNIGAMAKVAAFAAVGNTLSTPCTAGMPKDGKAGGAICNEVAGQLAASLSSQTAPSAKNMGAIAQVAAVAAVGATLSKPCIAGMPKDGKAGAAGSAICNEVAAQLTASLSSQTAPSAKNISAGMQAAVSNALMASAVQKISQMLPGSQQPIVGDLLTLGLKRQLSAGANDIGTFAPPSNSALPMGTEGLRSGLSIISNDKGQAGLGVKSDVEVGSKKFEISGSLDPNSNSDQGKSAGVQIKIGGD